MDFHTQFHTLGKIGKLNQSARNGNEKSKPWQTPERNLKRSFGLIEQKERPARDFFEKPASRTAINALIEEGELELISSGRLSLGT